MLGSLRTLLTHAIDYAGLFPPAALPMEQAVAEFGALRHESDAWMIRRFVCPVSWLADLVPLLPASVETPWALTVLGTSLEGYRPDMNLIERFEEAVGGRATVEGYEVKAHRNDLQLGVLKQLANAGFDEVYVELPWGDDQVDGLHTLASLEGIGAKARTGGLEPAAFPSNAALARFVHECVSLDLPFKLTAGLHHPLPHHDANIAARMHGFLNLLVGVALTLAHDLSREELTSILATDDPKAFWFTDRGAGWGDREADLTDLAQARELLVSWGSCSIAEPIEDLTTLGLWPASTR